MEMTQDQLYRLDAATGVAESFSNSNLPTWQVEGGFPRLLRLAPRAPAALAAQVR
ncbi:MAG: hypothetical protein ACREI8_02710 [Myxococcota bacterium]